MMTHSFDRHRNAIKLFMYTHFCVFILCMFQNAFREINNKTISNMKRRRFYPPIGIYRFQLFDLFDAIEIILMVYLYEDIDFLPMYYNKFVFHLDFSSFKIFYDISVWLSEFFFSFKL